MDGTALACRPCASPFMQTDILTPTGEDGPGPLGPQLTGPRGPHGGVSSFQRSQPSRAVDCHLVCALQVCFRENSGGSMADPRAFLSFDFDHNEVQKRLFAGQARSDSPSPFTIQDWSSKTSLPQSQWEALIKRKLAYTHMCIVLVGRHMATATGVAKEIAMAKELLVPVFGVYVDGAGPTSTLPLGLQRNRTMPWNWVQIAAAVQQMMGEGKNA